MDKLKFETKSGAERNIEQIAELFPEVITESRDKDGKLIKAVNWDTLKSLLGSTVEGRAESYDFTWVGKREALIEAGAPMRKTLRPVRIDETIPSGADSSGKPYLSSGSVNFDTTQNLYIEGDNLDVLKLLTDSYLGKVKMIYIDPPYNTGKDFVYKDRFTMSQEEYDEATDATDEDGNKTFSENLTTNPRFHSDWCRMIYARLKVARNLLKDDGVIFISIDDNEVHNLRKICDEIFGASNFFATLTRRAMHTVRNSSKDFNNNSDFILAYAKDKTRFTVEADNLIREKIDKTDSYPFDDNDGKGAYKLDPIYARNYARPYIHTFANGIVWEAPEGSFPRYSQESLRAMEAGNELDFKGKQPRAKRYLARVQVGQPPDTIMREENVGFNLDGTRVLSSVLEHDKVFSQPKPVKLISYLINLLKYKEDDIILDFFSGSATTAHAVMQLNAEDGGKRKFLMVQIPQETESDTEAFKAGYTNICEIGKERIRRAGAKIAEENRMTAPNLDIGFRVFKLDESNFKDVHFSAGELAKLSLFDTLAENLKDDRTAEDLLYSCILEWGLSLTLPHTEETIEGKKVFVVNGGDLIACFEKDLPESVIKAIANRKPLNALFRESCFKDSPAKINNEEIFKLISPSTKVKVL